MAFVPISANHESPYELTPMFSQKQINTGTWGTGGNTCLITDNKIHPNSQVEVWVTGVTPAAGQWAYIIAQGTVTITSSNSENAALPVSYLVF